MFFVVHMSMLHSQEWSYKSILCAFVLTFVIFRVLPSRQIVSCPLVVFGPGLTQP
jgi:hypothetical protein